MNFGLRSAQIAQTTRHVGTLARLSFYIAGTVAFGLVAAAILTAWNRVAQGSIEAARPVLQIAAPELAKLPFQARAARSGTGWYELLQFGQLPDRDVDFTLAVEMPKAAEHRLPRDFRREMADLHQIASASFSYPEYYYDLETRFGPVRAARFQIMTDGRYKLCMGYISRFETAALNLKGWYCEANGSKPSPYGLACLLDKITANAALPSPAAQTFYSQRAARGPRCAADPVTQTTDTGPRKPLRRLVY